MSVVDMGLGPSRHRSLLSSGLQGMPVVGRVLGPLTERSQAARQEDCRHSNQAGQRSSGGCYLASMRRPDDNEVPGGLEGHRKYLTSL